MAKREGGPQASEARLGEDDRRSSGSGKREGGRGQREAGRGRSAEKKWKCPSCGGSEHEEGTLALYNSISYLVFSSEKRPFVTLGNSLRSRVCLGCGRVEFYAPRKAFGKTNDDREP